MLCILPCTYIGGEAPLYNYVMKYKTLLDVDVNVHGNFQDHIHVHSVRHNSKRSVVVDVVLIQRSRQFRM